MLFWTDEKTILYLQDYPYEINDSFKIQPSFIANRIGINHNEVSIVILNKRECLTFFYVCNCEENFETKEVKGRIFKNREFVFFVKQYFKTQEKSFIISFIKDLNLKENISSFIRFSLTPSLRKYELRPFGTLLPIIASNIYIKNVFSAQLISRLDKSKIELKSRNQIIFSTDFLLDDSKEYVIKKGIEFFFEYFEDGYYLGFNYTNFLRSVKPINKLNLKEPIDRKNHKFINIITGKRPPLKFIYIKDIDLTEQLYETYTNTAIYDVQFGRIRFSQEAFHFEQTNLNKTVQLIFKLESCLKTPMQTIDFSNLNIIDWNFKIIKRKRKFVFSEGELHFTSSKGLYHSGVLQIPKDFKLQFLVSKKVADLKGRRNILNDFNEAIKFLFKGFVSSIEENDLLIYDYNNFDTNFFSKLLDLHKSVITYIVDPYKTSYNLTKEQSELLNSINFQIIDILKIKSDSFTIIGEIDKYVFANAILKIGLKKGAIPWKIDSIDPDDSSHIFIGIDLGHDHEKRLSNLTITAISNQGCLIDCAKATGIEINEKIPMDIIEKIFKRLFHKLIEKKQLIKNITIHRDGRFFENIPDFEEAIRKALKGRSELQINLVEVVKSDVPLIGFKNGTQYVDSFEGLYLFVGDTSYLVTNDQCLNTETAPKPLKIRKISGYKTINQLTEEIYWLTKPYSINLFLPSKLPLTTLLANNLSYTGGLVHFITI